MSTLPNKYLRSAYDRITGLNTRFRIMTGKVSMINRDADLRRASGNSRACPEGRLEHRRRCPAETSGDRP